MTTTATLTVPQRQIDRGDAVAGPRDRAMRVLRERGHVLWLRADGSAQLFYLDGGNRRQKTWARFTIHREEAV